MGFVPSIMPHIPRGRVCQRLKFYRQTCANRKMRLDSIAFRVFKVAQNIEKRIKYRGLHTHVLWNGSYS